MRLTDEQVQIIANRIVRGLAKAGYLLIEEEPDELESMVIHVISDELRVEDRLNDEVRELMREHMDRIRRADVEYHEMFKVIKAKLARERDLIL